MKSNRYPLRLHHPHTSNVHATVTSKKEEDAWRDQGWRVTEPDIPVSDEPGEVVTDEPPEPVVESPTAKPKGKSKSE